MSKAFRGLLDVNVLVAHAVIEHEHHSAVVQWHRCLPTGADLFTCPIIELGLVRNLMRIASVTVADARVLLANEQENLKLNFIPDTLGAESLPDWVQGYSQTTDAYLRELARAHDIRFVTLDKRIPETVSILGS